MDLKLLNPMMALKDRKSFIRAIRNAKRIASGKRAAAACKACRKSHVRLKITCNRCVTLNLVDSCKEDASNEPTVSSLSMKSSEYLRTVKKEASGSEEEPDACKKTSSFETDQQESMFPSYSCQPPAEICRLLNPFFDLNIVPATQAQSCRFGSTAAVDDEPTGCRTFPSFPHLPHFLQAQAANPCTFVFPRGTLCHDASSATTPHVLAPRSAPWSAMSPASAPAHTIRLPPLADLGLFRSQEHGGDLPRH
jgi:hypothetical protein